MTSNGSGAAEFDPQHHSIRQREKAGLVVGTMQKGPASLPGLSYLNQL
jgi:hypothetical protein